MRNLQRILLAVCLILVISIGCDPQPEFDGLTIEDFDFLEERMSYEEIELTLGESGVEVGSGFFIIMYTLENGSLVYLHFLGDPNNLMNARMVHSDGSEETLLPWSENN